MYGETLELEGWVLDGELPVHAVEAWIDGTVVERAPVNVSRADVAAAHPDAPGAAEAGFVLTIDAPRAAAFAIELRAVRADESRYPLGVVRGRHRTRDLPSDGVLVSVVVPCHNQAPFVAEAIHSIREQTYRAFELVVVDDGSSDESTEIVAGLGAPYVRQERMGRSAARNTGLRVTTGDYVVFLDGDNRVLPYALEANLHAFEDHPGSAFVGGRYTYIDELGARWRGGVPPDPRTPEDHYAALLAENYFGSPDNVMFRRSVLDEVGVFDSSVDGLEDYDLYLRIAKDHPVRYHGVTISECRVHESQFSRDRAMMLRSSVRVLRRHRGAARRSPARREAYRRGLAHWRGAYGKALANQLRSSLRERRWSEAQASASALLRWHPTGLLGELSKSIVRRLSKRRPVHSDASP